MNDEKKLKKSPVIEFEGKEYIFSLKSILIFAIGTPILSYLIYLFFDLEFNYWLHEIVVKQTVFFLNLLFDMGVTAEYDPSVLYYSNGTTKIMHWRFLIPGRASIGFETFCTGIQAICVFAGIIIFTPHSKDPATSEDMIWRKTKSLIVSSVIFYVVNIIRMLIQLYLYYIGYPWESIHYSISAASSFIAAIIVLLLHKWIPEFIISIIYTGTLISQPIKARRREKAKDIAKAVERVNLEIVRKAIGMREETFQEKFPEMAGKFGFKIEKEFLLVPEERFSAFSDALDAKFKQDNEKVDEKGSQKTEKKADKEEELPKRETEISPKKDSNIKKN